MKWHGQFIFKWTAEDIKKNFINELYFTNFERSRIFSIILFIMFSGLVISDISRIDYWSRPGYNELFYVHAATLSALIVFLIIFFKFRINTSSDITLLHKTTVKAFCLVLMIQATATSSVDQFIHGQASAYIITVFGVAAGFLLTPLFSAGLYLLSLALFITGVTFTQNNQQQLTGHYINGTTLTLVALFLSYILRAGFRKNFLHRITIDNQNDQLAGLMKINDTIFQAMPVGVLRYSPDGEIEQSNKQLSRMLGLSTPLKNLSEMKENGWEIFDSDGGSLPFDEFPLIKSLTNRKKTHTPCIGIRIPGNETLWVDINTAPINKDTGDSTIAVLTDVTENKLMEEMLGAVHLQSPIAILIIDTNEKPARLLSINPAIKSMLGAETEDEFLFNFTSFLPEMQNNGLPSLEYFHDSCEEALSLGRLQKEFIFLRTDGIEIICEINFVKISLVAQPHLLAIISDITERKSSEERITKMNEELSLVNIDLTASNEEFEAMNEELIAVNEELINAEKSIRESSEKYRLITENSDDVIWTTDRDLKYTYISPSTKKLRGYDPEESMNQSIAASITPESQKIMIDEYNRLLPEILAGGNPTARLEVEIYRKDGSTVWVEISVRPTRDENGNLTGFVGASRDISERKKFDAELQMRNLLLLTQQEVSLDGIYAVDEDGIMISFNRRFTEMWKNPDEFTKKIGHLYENHTEKIREEIRLEDGLILDSYSAPMIGHDGRYFGRIWYFRDVTQQKLSEMALRESAAFL
jgi:PAS domain S-box-containing protein